ncbi:MAG TPA: DUF4865 family protein, partial [Stellaceae bacterium]|nr:DUF4865 family protein [Stellaceae bacterium]
WSSIGGMNRFLWGGGGFGNIVASFGRPAVRHWTGVACAQGPAWGSAPAQATRLIEPIAADADPTAAVEAARGQMRRRANLPGVHSSALAIDPLSWSLVHFTLWRDAVHKTSGIRYQVLHLSMPEWDAIVAPSPAGQM